MSGGSRKTSPIQKLPIDNLIKLWYNNYSKRKGNDTMRTVLVICAIIVSGGAVTRFVASIDRKKPLWGLMWWSFMEIVAIALLFDNFAIGA